MAERISTPSKTKEIIEANRFAFKKNFGQNFLIDSNILDNIAACAGVTKEDCVLEIGPGIGSLTQVLAENAGQVVAVEIDNTLIPILKQTLADYDNIEILNQDILKTDIDAIIQEKNDGRPIKAVANLTLLHHHTDYHGSSGKRTSCGQHHRYGAEGGGGADAGTPEGKGIRRAFHCGAVLLRCQAGHDCAAGMLHAAPKGGFCGDYAKGSA